jgi:uncharacterized OsmC-like protein
MFTTLPAMKQFTEDPAAARTRPAVSAVLANGHARISGGPFNWDSDLPPVVGGSNQAPSPTAYLLGALAGCAVTFINDTLAPEFDVRIDDVRADVSCEADLAGLVALEGHDPALTGLRIDITVSSTSERDRISALQQAWAQRCPIYLALLRPNEITLTFA